MKVVGFDTETDSPKRGGRFAVQEAKLVGYSLSNGPGEAIYVDGLPTALKDFFEGPDIKVVHSKFEYTKLAQIGIELRNFEDTKIAAMLLGQPSTRLKELTHQLLGINPINYDEATQGREMPDIPPEEIVDYAAADADHTRRLWTEHLEPSLRREDLWGLYERVERPLTPVLARMETRGTAIDPSACWRAESYFDTQMRAAEYWAHAQGIPGDVAVGSRAQLSTWLEEAGAPLDKRTKVTQRLEVSEATLGDLESDGWRPELVRALVDYFQYQKMKSFPVSFLTLSGWDGAIHPNFNQSGTHEEGGETTQGGASYGRLSCSSPNSQQVPKHGLGKQKGRDYPTWAKMIRSCLVAREGYVLVAADVSQQEPRIAAYVSGEQSMLEAFAAGQDVYSAFGQQIYGRPVDTLERDVGKRSILSFFWRGHSGKAWQSRLSQMDPAISRSEAIWAYERLVESYPAIEAFRESVWQGVRKDGYTRDWFGRTRWFPGAFSANYRKRESAFRQAINHHIQGPAASCIKLAMIRIDREIREAGLDAHLLLQVHDEIVFEVRVAELRELLSLVAHMLDGVMDDLAFPIEAAVGVDWGSMKEVQI